jgi:hypothetical protein
MDYYQHASADMVSLARHGVQARVGSAYGDAELPPGMRAVTGVRN